MTFRSRATHIKRIGYDNTEYGIDYGLRGHGLLRQTKQTLLQGVNHASDDHLNTGAGDQA